MGRSCVIIDLGRISYGDALTIQEDLVERRLKKEIPDVLLLLEHEPVITLGRKATLRGWREHLKLSPGEIESEGVEIYHASRGGLATYHGPGQLVGYPIVDLPAGKMDIKFHMDRLCGIMSSTLESYDISSRIENGVWIGDEKIGSTGAAIISKYGRHVTMHGFSFNVSTDLFGFDFIIPCGMPDGKITSLEEVLGRTIPISEICEKVIKEFGSQFGYDRVYREELSAVVGGKDSDRGKDGDN